MTLLLNRPVDRRIDRRKLHHLDQILPRQKTAVYTAVRLHCVDVNEIYISTFQSNKKSKVPHIVLNEFQFKFVREKVSFCILCGRPVTHRSPNDDPTRPDPTRPATGAGRPDRFPSLILAASNQDCLIPDDYYEDI